MLWGIRNGEEFIKSCSGTMDEVLGEYVHLLPLKAAIGVMFRSVNFDVFNSQLIELLHWRAVGCGLSGALPNPGMGDDV